MFDVNAVVIFQPLTHVMARSIVSKLPVHKPILLAIALKDTSAPMLRAVEDLVLECRIC